MYYWYLSQVHLITVWTNELSKHTSNEVIFSCYLKSEDKLIYDIIKNEKKKNLIICKRYFITAISISIHVYICVEHFKKK